MWMSLQVSLYIACCSIFFLSSEIFACPFCGPVETPISYTIMRSSEAAVGESITRPQADIQGQRRQSFSLLSKIILTSTGRALMPLDSSVDIEATVETSFSGTALLFNLPATGWTAIQADEMLISYVLQAPPAKQNFLKRSKSFSMVCAMARNTPILSFQMMLMLNMHSLRFKKFKTQSMPSI